MKTFIALKLLMGVVYKSSIPLHWSDDEFFHTPTFQKAMTRKSFQLMLKFLHFNGNANPIFDINDDGCNRLYIVRLLVELQHDHRKRVYAHGQNVSIDES